MIDIKSDSLCHIRRVNWEQLAASEPIAFSMANQYNALPNDICWDTCPQDCADWDSKDGISNSPINKQYCLSATVCQKQCRSLSKTPKQYCRVDTIEPGESIVCNVSCLAGCYGPSSADCISCKDVMDLELGLCVPSCPPGKVTMFKMYCVTPEFCRSKQYRIYDRGCLAKCPPNTNDHPTDKHACVECEAEECRRVDHTNRTIFYEENFPEEKFTEIDGYLVISTEGMGVEKLNSKMPQFSKLHNITGALQIQRSARILNLDMFSNLQEIGSNGCAYANNICLTIHSNEFLQKLWTPKNGKKLVVRKGNVSIAHNPRLCKNEIERFIKLIDLKDTGATIFHSDNGDRGYCESMHITHFKEIDQYPIRTEPRSPRDREAWKISPLVAFNLTCESQLLSLSVYHRRSNEIEKLTYFDPALCDAKENEWKRHTISNQVCSIPDYWRVVDNETLFITNVSTPINTQMNARFDFS